MSILQAVLLGALQGFTEFLPVSSSGHLVLARAVMGLEKSPVLFDVILHMATLIVVIWTFRYRLGSILLALYHFLSLRANPDERTHLNYMLRVIEASALTALVGVGIYQLDIHDDPFITGVFFLVTALILLTTRFIKGKDHLNLPGRVQSFIIGIAQGFGVLPGISRSGITISTGLLLGLSRRAAGEFSFLLSIPAILGALFLSLKDIGELSSVVPPSSLIAGFLTAVLTGYVFLRLLLWLISHGKLWIFAIYLIPAGSWVILSFRGF